MARSMRAPETKKLDLAHGDWLIVKKRLTAGEQRRIFDRMVKQMHAGEKPDLDPMQVGHSQVLEYLVDWGTFTDASGKPLVIRGKGPDEIGRILNDLDTDDYADIVAAIDEHVTAMDAERAAEKNARDGESAASATSPSVA